MKLLALVLLSTLVLAASSCPNYAYKDFVWASDYQPPIRPPDTILDECENLGLKDSQVCNVIGNNNLTESEQKQVIIDALTTNPLNQSLEWNNKLKTTKYVPDGSIAKNGSYFKDAWIAITSIQPSVTNNETLVNTTGRLYVASGFSFVVPRETFPADCDTIYEVCGYDYSVKTYNNGELLENNEFTANRVNNFSAVLSVNGRYLIHHYKLKRTCTPRGGCVTLCEYALTENRQETLSLEANKTAFKQENNATSIIFVDNFDNGLLDLWLSYNSTNFNALTLNFEGSYLKIKQSSYYLNHSLAPYNYLNTYFANQNSTLVNNASILSRQRTLNGEKLHLLVPSNAVNCSLTINKHFETTVNNTACEYNEENPLLELKVNKTNELLFVVINFSQNQPLANKNIILTYANQTVSLLTNSNGQANATLVFVKGSSVVTAEFVTDFETKSAKTRAVIPFENPIAFIDLIYLAYFLFFAFVVYDQIKGWFVE